MKRDRSSWAREYSRRRWADPVKRARQKQAYARWYERRGRAQRQAKAARA